MTQDTAEFVAQARAKLNLLTGVTEPIKVGDRVRYADCEYLREQYPKVIGGDAGYVIRIETVDGVEKVWFNNGWEPASNVEVNPWVEWEPAPCPKELYDEMVELRYPTGKTKEVKAGNSMAYQWEHRRGEEPELFIVAYRVLKKV